MGIEKRIQELEQKMAPQLDEDVEIHYNVVDARLEPEEPDFLGMITLSATRTRPGKTFTRAEGESEKDFMQRVSAYKRRFQNE